MAVAGGDKAGIAAGGPDRPCIIVALQRFHGIDERRLEIRVAKRLLIGTHRQHIAVDWLRHAQHLNFIENAVLLSQSQLAKASGVSIRSIQLFEQRKSNINNAQYNHLSAIAKVLCCEVEDLME